MKTDWGGSYIAARGEQMRGGQEEGGRRERERKKDRERMFVAAEQAGPSLVSPRVKDLCLSQGRQNN